MLYDYQWLIAMIIFAITFIITPGPNNIMFAGSGINHGLKKSIPHIMGVSIGSPSVFIGLLLGVDALLNIAVFKELYRWFCMAYLLYLAYSIATTSQMNADIEVGKGKPIGFIKAFLFQWTNPKVWTQYLIVIGAFLSDRDDLYQVSIIFLVFLLVGLFNGVLWTIVGVFMSSYVKSHPRAYRLLNILLAVVLLILVMPYIWKF